MALTITRRGQEGISILELHGRLTFGPEDIAFNDEIRHAIAARRVRLVIDLGGVDKIDSAGLGTLLYARAELRRAGGGLALAKLKTGHLQILLVAKLDTVFDIFESEQDAINSFFPERCVPHYDLLDVIKGLHRDGARDLQPAS
jgi:anti-sigma B factor antagonist